MFVALTLIIILTIIIILLINQIAIQKANKIYTYIDNDNDIDTAKDYITYTNYIYNKTPLQNYRIGSIYDHVLNDNQLAEEYYNTAINQAIFNPDEDAVFIQLRLRDRIDNNEIIDIDDNFDPFNLNELQNNIAELEEVLLGMAKTNEKKEGKIDLHTKIKWTEDSQNVHDSNINNELQKSYQSIKQSNKGVYVYDINDIKNYFNYTYQKDYPEGDTHNLEDAVKMIDYIQNKSFDKIYKIDDTEKNYMRHIFTKIYNEQNNDKRKTLMENLLLNLKESYQKGYPVCITGRITRVMTSFAETDNNNPAIGILKSKPVIRNEILMKAGAVRNEIYDKATKELQDKYNKSSNDEETKEFEEKMKKEIRDMIQKDYSEISKNDKKFIDNIITEIENDI